MHLGMEPGLLTSMALMRGTRFHPRRSRAATAGNSALRSLVRVKKTAAMSSERMSFAAIILLRSSSVASIISLREFSGTVVAPLTPRTAVMMEFGEGLGWMGIGVILLPKRLEEFGGVRRGVGGDVRLDVVDECATDDGTIGEISDGLDVFSV